MKQKSIFSLLLPFLFLLSLTIRVHGQAQTSKVGGVCFRVDDDQLYNKWVQYSNIFKKYDYKFSFAINFTTLLHNPKYLQLLKDFQAAGNELMDHTPDHFTQFFSVEDSSPYAGLKGVDHITDDNTKVCLAYQPIDTARASRKIMATLGQNTLITRDRGGLQSVTPFSVFYVPAINKLFSFQTLRNSTSQDADTATLLTFWRENVALPHWDSDPVTVYILDQEGAVQLTDEAVSLLVEKTLKICEEKSFIRPYSWIHPGALSPQISARQIKRIMGDRYGYKASSCSALENSLHCFNEDNPRSEMRYSLQWGDFDGESLSLGVNKALISDKVAKHYVMIDRSHFLTQRGGDWNAYLGKMDSLLAWCHRNYDKIPVKTYSQWADELYGEATNPDVNIIPPLNVDVDGNGLPDGYFRRVDGVLDTTEGINECGHYSCLIGHTGTICKIIDLAGIEKGDNEFGIWMRGSVGSKVEASFSMAGIDTVRYSFVVTDTSWKFYPGKDSVGNVSSFHVPSNVSTMTIEVKCTRFAGKWVKISNMSLHRRTTAQLKIVSTPDTLIAPTEKYQYRLEILTRRDNNAFALSLQAPSWLSLTDNQTIVGDVPLTAIGDYPILINVTDKFGYTDTQSFQLAVATATDMNDVKSPLPPPSVFSLEQSYPNPFNPTTRLQYAVANSRFISLKIYDLVGREVATLVNEQRDAGIYTVQWDGSNYASGTYLCRLQAGDFSQTKKMVLIK
jgi:hypothetical protein